LISLLTSLIFRQNRPIWIIPRWFLLSIVRYFELAIQIIISIFVRNEPRLHRTIAFLTKLLSFIATHSGEMENNSPSRSFFGCSAFDHPLITSSYIITSNNLSIPWIGSVGSTRLARSAVTSPGSAGSPPGDQAEMARRKLKRILHLRSPLSSIENLNPHRVVGPTSKVVPPMNVGTKEDDVLVMDAVPIQVC
jgi:hypothetical protein